MTEMTFVMVKPDGVRRKLIGEVIRRMEAKGLTLMEIKRLQMDTELAGRHYQEHKGKHFYEGLVSHICSGPVIAMLWQGENAVELARLLIGHRDPLQATPGTIRGDYAAISAENIVHGADSIQSAKREASLYFEDVRD